MTRKAKNTQLEIKTTQIKMRYPFHLTKTKQKKTLFAKSVANYVLTLLLDV